MTNEDVQKLIDEFDSARLDHQLEVDSKQPVPVMEDELSVTTCGGQQVNLACSRSR
jgi:hypothetical protein